MPARKRLKTNPYDAMHTCVSGLLRKASADAAAITGFILR
jgi:hypothetical protein